eukprot:440444-Prorocentrum_minimum.AAC.1
MTKQSRSSEAPRAGHSGPNFGNGLKTVFVPVFDFVPQEAANHKGNFRGSATGSRPSTATSTSTSTSNFNYELGASQICNFGQGCFESLLAGLLRLILML